MTSRQVGFTLIELMITVAILAILAMVAVPTYTEQMKKGSAAAAKQWLLEIANVQEGYRANYRKYAATLGDVNMATPPSDVNDYYIIALTGVTGTGTSINCTGTATATGYCVTATPKTGTRQAGEPVLKLDHRGNKLPADAW